MKISHMCIYKSHVKLLSVFFLIPIFAVSLFPLIDAEIIEQDHKTAFDHAEYVIIGRILSVEILSEPDIQTSSNTNSRVGIALYEIEVEEYLKNPLETKIIKFPGKYVDEKHSGDTIDSLYEVDQRVLLYIQSDYPDTLMGYDMIIRSNESQILDGSICNPNAYYYEGVCIVVNTPELEDQQFWGNLAMFNIAMTPIWFFSGVIYWAFGKKYKKIITLGLIVIGFIWVVGIIANFIPIAVA